MLLSQQNVLLLVVYQKGSVMVLPMSKSWSDSIKSSLRTIPTYVPVCWDNWEESRIGNAWIKLFTNEDYISNHNIYPSIDSFTHMVTSILYTFKSRAPPQQLCYEMLKSELSDATTHNVVAADCNQLKIMLSFMNL